MAPFREREAFWRALLRSGRRESHYCPRCRRTQPFRRWAHRLRCLGCLTVLERPASRAR